MGVIYYWKKIINPNLKKKNLMEYYINPSVPDKSVYIWYHAK